MLPTSRPPLPGPKAKAIIERDAQFVSPSYTRGYPVRHRARRRARSSRTSTATSSSTAPPASPSTPPAHSHPDVVTAITEQAQKFLHMSGTDFYYEPQVRLAEELAAIAPIDGRRAVVLRQLGHRGRSRPRIKLARYHTKRPGHHRVPRRVPRPHDGRAVADGEQGDPAPRLRPAACPACITRRTPTAIAARSA